MNFIKALPEVLTEYGIAPSRILADGEGIMHFELTDGMWLMCKEDSRVTYWSEEALLNYIEFVVGE